VGSLDKDSIDRAINKRKAKPARLHLRIVLVDDHEVTRLGLFEMATQLAIVVVVHAVASPNDAREFLSAEAADFLLVTADLDESEIRTLVSAAPGAALLLLMWTIEDQTLGKVASLPVRGFLIEHDLTSETLARAFWDVAAGGTAIPRTVADRLFRLVRRRQHSTGYGLTSREQEVLGLLVEGLSNKQIGKRLGMSAFGAKRHVSTVLAKLNCENRTEAVARALSEGLLTGN